MAYCFLLFWDTFRPVLFFYALESVHDSQMNKQNQHCGLLVRLHNNYHNAKNKKPSCQWFEILAWKKTQQSNAAKKNKNNNCSYLTAARWHSMWITLKWETVL